ncbi:ankyrin repeat domain-containing protein [bacterium]|nr:ankyrin repeat domain-containing protein [bacterium]
MPQSPSQLLPAAAAALILVLFCSACPQGPSATAQGKGGPSSATADAQSTEVPAADVITQDGRSAAVKGDGLVSTVFIDASETMKPEAYTLEDLRQLRTSLAPAEAYGRFTEKGYSFDALGACKAATAGDGEALACFIAAGGDIHSGSEAARYDTPLLTAVAGGFGTLSEFLLDEGADIEYRDRLTQSTAAAWAAILGNVEMLKLLQRRGADLMVRCGPKQQNLLIYAAQTGSTEALRYLLQQGLPVDDTDSIQLNALMVAAKGGYTDCCRVLVEGGADVNYTEPDRGYTPLLAACYMLKYETADYLISAGGDKLHKAKDGSDAVFMIGLSGSAEGVEWLVRQQMDLNARRPLDGATLLMLCSAKGDARAVEALLLAHADPTLSDNAGRSALTYAREAQKSETEQLLLRVLPEKSQI